MSARLWDLLAWIGLACVLCTPVVVALLAMAGRREEEEDDPLVGVLMVFRGARMIARAMDVPEPPADPVRELAARAKGGDE